jgi:hypothetical protein
MGHKEEYVSWRGIYDAINIVECSAVAIQQLRDGRLYQTPSKQRLGKHVAGATDSHATVESDISVVRSAASRRRR